MLVLVRDPAILLDLFKSIGFDGQIGGVGQVCTDGAPDQELESHSAIIVTPVDLVIDQEIFLL